MLSSDIATLAKLPSYDSINSPLPCYSSDPVCGEQSILCTPRSRSRPSGKFVHKVGSITVLLMDQEEGATVPVYGRQSIVNGIISLGSREVVSEVRVKVG